MKAIQRSQHPYYHQLPGAELITVRFEEEKRGHQIHTLCVVKTLDGRVAEGQDAPARSQQAPRR